MFHRENQRESGSVSILTLLAFSLLAGMFLYVALIGSRTADTTKVRVAADSTAMAAATVKAKVMNMESYVLLADTVLLPLAHVADNIRTAQIAGAAACFVLFGPWSPYCWIKYPKHMIETWKNRPAVKKTADDWLDGLDAMADALRTVGPLWAEVAAVRAGTSDSYQGKGAAVVSTAASFPVPAGEESRCSQLGIELVSSEDAIRDGDNPRGDACHDKGWFGEAYIAVGALKDPQAALLDLLGWEITLRSLLLPLPCSKEIRVPKLTDDWKDHSISYGMAMSENTTDRDILPIMDRLMLKNQGKGSPDRPLGDLRSLVRVACAEHYSQDHHSKNSDGKQESLWHMDWRARLVPCDFEDEQSKNAIESCGASAGLATLIAGGPNLLKMQLQFAYQRSTGAAKYWKF